MYLLSAQDTEGTSLVNEDLNESKSTMVKEACIEKKFYSDGAPGNTHFQVFGESRNPPPPPHPNPSSPPLLAHPTR
jgi:hypothetical protein